MAASNRLAGVMGSAAPDLLDAFVESIADGIYVVDHRGDVIFANAAAVGVLGYDAEDELLGRPSHATIHHTRPSGEPFPEEECPLLRPRTTGEAVRVEDDWFVRRDGSLVPVAYSSAPVATPHGRGAVVVFHDVSRRIELEASRARIVSATDAERRRLGRDLHDGAQQRLTNVVVALQLAARAAGDEAAAPLGEALAEAQRAISDLRAFAAGLHPPILTSRGLAAAVHGLTARAPLPVTVDVPERRLSPDLEAGIYFVIAEALANAGKHAQARGATVRVVIGEEAVVVEVGDDGRGGASAEGGSGLVGLADRVAAHGGTLAVVSPPGDGTCVRATFPLAAPS